MDEGTLFLVVSLVLVAVVLGGYAWYLTHRGRAARLSMVAHAAKEPEDKANSYEL